MIDLFASDVKNPWSGRASSRGREICVRLPLDGDTIVDVVIPDGQVLHSDVEFGALAQEYEQCGIPFGMIDAKPARARASFAVW